MIITEYLPNNIDNLRKHEILKQEWFASLQQKEDRVKAGLKTFIEVGETILDIRDSELWKLRGYPDWESYCKATWNFGKSRASQLISAARKAKRVQDVTGVTIPNERVARELNTILEQYTDSIQEIALDALSKRGGVLTQERLRNELDVLAEYKTTGHVTRADGEQSALDSAIKSGRKELETNKRYYIAQNIETECISEVGESGNPLLHLTEIEIGLNAENLLRGIEHPRKVHVSVWIEKDKHDGTEGEST